MSGPALSVRSEAARASATGRPLEPPPLDTQCTQAALLGTSVAEEAIKQPSPSMLGTQCGILQLSWSDGQ